MQTLVFNIPLAILKFSLKLDCDFHQSTYLFNLGLL